jgi:hypothetical protein
MKSASPRLVRSIGRSIGLSLLLAGAIGLSACSSDSSTSTETTVAAENATETSVTETNDTETSVADTRPAGVPDTLAATPAGSIEVQLHAANDQCDAYNKIPQLFVAETAPAQVVSIMLANSRIEGFTIASHSVSIADGVATIDMTLPPDASRTFASLASCERFSLLGAIEATFANNPGLGASEVKFLENGKDLEI